MIKYVLPLFILTTPMTSNADIQLTNGQLKELCSSEDRWYGGLCNGYITGTVESLLELREQGLISEAFCFPVEMKRGSYIESIRKAINSKQPHNPAFETIVLTLKDRYPCE